MPELPEVERARKLVEDTCKGYRIKAVDSREDKIVYCGGTDHVGFAKEIEGRTITGCERKGKMFWLTLSGEGRLPIMHFGMTGMVMLKGQEPTCIFELEPQEGSVSQEPRELAFIDARRLARLRLLPTPVLSHPPLSLLGFDPVLSHPTLEEFQTLIAKKKGTTKGMIMDQAFSAGVGNWVADEILYQARIHPACPVNLLTEKQIVDLHFQIRDVPLTAVKVNAAHQKFPEGWLFRWRWGKGKKHERGKGKAKLESEDDGEDLKPKGKKYMETPDGAPATIVFIEVSGRTTALVEEVQKMPEGVEIKPKITKGGKGSRSKRGKGDDDESDASSDLTEEEEKKPKISTPRQKAGAKQAAQVEMDSGAEEVEAKSKRNAKSRKVAPIETEAKPSPDEVVAKSKRGAAAKRTPKVEARSNDEEVVPKLKRGGSKVSLLTLSSTRNNVDAASSERQTTRSRSKPSPLPKRFVHHCIGRRLLIDLSYSFPLLSWPPCIRNLASHHVFRTPLDGICQPRKATSASRSQKASANKSSGRRSNVKSEAEDGGRPRSESSELSDAPE
ncbi:formamidopyrimidine-DNA glycosylase, partial [Tremellales sp. Uapishka_1]